MGVIVAMRERASSSVRVARGLVSSALQESPLGVLPRATGWRKLLAALLASGPVSARTDAACARLVSHGSVGLRPCSNRATWVRPRYAQWHTLNVDCVSDVDVLSLGLCVHGSDAACLHRLAPLAADSRRAFCELLDEVRCIQAQPGARSHKNKRDDRCSSARLAAAEPAHAHLNPGRIQVAWRKLLQLGCRRGCRQLSTAQLASVLQQCMERRVALQVCVVNAGLAHGSVLLPRTFCKDAGRWLLGARHATLELAQADMGEIWLLSSAQEQGVANCIDVLDKQGALAFRLCGRPTPGIAEAADWRQLLTAVCCS